MTIKASGTLSIQEINAEFGRGNDLNSYRGTKYWLDNGSSGTFPSVLNTIAISDFYNKRLSAPTLRVDYLIVGGGGGGATGTYDHLGGGGGGGGGGGVRTGTIDMLAGTTYYVNIGQGGAAGYINERYQTGVDNYNNPVYGSDYIQARAGTATSFYNLLGGTYNLYTSVAGGEPGLARWYKNYATKQDVQFSTPYKGGNAGGYSIYGNAGGTFSGYTGQPGGSDGVRGGGGGAGGDDINSIGHGGAGPRWLDGTYYAGGGGGGADYSTYGSGGTGGGGHGGSGNGDAVQGVDGTGGGGGGGRSNAGYSYGVGGRGGHGIVVIRYAGARRQFSPSSGTSAFIYTSGGYTYHGFTTTGWFTANLLLNV